MARRLVVALDHPGPFRAGDRIRGRAVLHTDEAATTRGGAIVLSWRTRGRANVDTTMVASLRVGPVDVRPGSPLELPFDLEVGPGPPSFVGALVGVEWVVTARIDGAWSSDLVTEQIVEVVRIDTEATAPAGYRTAPRAASSRPALARAQRGDTTWVAAGALLVVLFAIRQLGAEVPRIFGVPGLVVGGLLLSLHGWPWLRNRLATRRIGAPIVEVPRAARGGDVLPITITLRPPAACRVARVIAIWTGVESATRGAGKSARTETSVVHREDQILAEGQTLPGDQAAVWSHVFHVPSGAPPSLQTSSSSVSWTMRVDVAIDGWPDHEQAFAVAIG